MRRRTLPIALPATLALSFLLAGCLHFPGPTSTPPTLALFGGPDGYELIHIPALARVELYRLALVPDAAAPIARRIGGTPIAAGPLPVTDTALKQLSAILRDSASYDFSASPQPPATPTRPTVALRFAGVKKTIDLLFSFPDRTLEVYESDHLVGRASFAPPRAADLTALLAPPAP